MKERPIIFSGPMVRAILDGQKTQTRRIVKRVPCENWIPEEMDMVTPEGWQWIGHSGRWWCECCSSQYVTCPYGKPGDRLWVRETCFAWEDEAGRDAVCYTADDGAKEPENSPEGADKWLRLYHYGGRRGGKVPAIHMPRWASRITLEVTAVRVERLQDISQRDAVSEGIESVSQNGFGAFRNYRFKTAHPKGREAITDEEHRLIGYQCLVRSFRSLWESINGDDSWNQNPWVWVVEFKRIGGKS